MASPDYVQLDETGVDLADLPTNIQGNLPPPTEPDIHQVGVVLPDLPASSRLDADEFGMVNQDDLPAAARERLDPIPVYVPESARAPAMDLTEIPTAALIAAGLPCPPPTRPAPPPSTPMDAMVAHRRRCSRCAPATKKSQLCKSGLALYLATR